MADHSPNRMGNTFTLKATRDRNRSMAKMPRAQLAAAIAARDRIAAVSTEIRERHGLPPLADGSTIAGARARLASMAKPKALDPAELRRKLEKVRAQEADLVAALAKIDGTPHSVRSPLARRSLADTAARAAAKVAA